MCTHVALAQCFLARTSKSERRECAPLSLEEHKRVLTLGSDCDSLSQVKLCVRELFTDVLKGASCSDFYLQLKDESWGE